jgi:hypothetical protein
MHLKYLSSEKTTYVWKREKNHGLLDYRFIWTLVGSKERSKNCG